VIRGGSYNLLRAAAKLAVGLLFAASPYWAQPPAAEPPTVDCSESANWNTPQPPFVLYGNSYYVGTRCLSAILITSAQGHVLIDGALPVSAELIERSIATLGFAVRDIRLILNSHAHHDHAGGIAALQAASGATVALSAQSARVLRAGVAGRDEPQFGVLSPFPAIPKVARVRIISDGEVVRVGPLSLTAHRTAGHSPGGTSWSWRSCDRDDCLDLVYADSQSPISADGFRYSASTTYPRGVQDFARGHATLEQLSCDVLVTPHPEASDLWSRRAARDSGRVSTLTDRDGCRRYAARAREALAKRLAAEQRAP
jgi:metallo-beta-lactamase class B